METKTAIKRTQPGLERETTKYLIGPKLTVMFMWWCEWNGMDGGGVPSFYLSIPLFLIQPIHCM